ncbi:MAG: YdcF family protein [Alphaproteobacteria bacterium]
MTRRKRILTFTLTLPLLWLIGFAAFASYALNIQPDKTIKTSDAIIVLTGGTDRVDTGLTLFASGKAANLFISGVHKDTPKKDIIALWKGQTALPPCCFDIGQTATTTLENAAEITAWTTDKKIFDALLVTSNYHMPRAMMEMRAAMPTIHFTPHAITQTDLPTHEKRIWELLFSEYHKFLIRFFTLLVS